MRFARRRVGRIRFRPRTARCPPPRALRLGIVPASGKTSSSETPELADHRVQRAAPTAGSCPSRSARRGSGTHRAGAPEHGGSVRARVAPGEDCRRALPASSTGWGRGDASLMTRRTRVGLAAQGTARPAPLLDLAELSFHLVPDRGDLVLVEPESSRSRAAATTSGSRSRQRSSSPSGRYFPGIAARMADEAVGRGLDELRPASAADPLDDLGGDGPNRPDVHPVHLRGGDLRAPPARGHDPPGSHVLHRRVLAVPVVLADEDDRQVQAPSRSSGTRRSTPGSRRRRRSTRPRLRRGPSSEIAAPVAAAMLPPTMP